MPSNQRLFHGGIKAATLADHLSARFNDRQHRAQFELEGESALVQIGSKHGGTPTTIHISDTVGGVLVSIGRDQNWTDKIADASDIFERAAFNPLSLISAIPDIVGEIKKENLALLIWNAIYDMCTLTRSLAGEIDEPKTRSFVSTGKQKTILITDIVFHVVATWKLSFREYVQNTREAILLMRCFARGVDPRLIEG